MRTDAPHRGRVLPGLVVWWRVVVALMLRDPTARHGHHGLGFFWVVGEPLVLTTGIIILWSTMGSGHGHDIPVALFGLTGYTFITMWRHIVFRSIRSMSVTANLAYHRQIRRVDVLIAWALIEWVSILAGFFITLLALSLWDSTITLRDPLTTLGGFALTAFLSFSTGLLLAGLSELGEAMHHFVQPLMYVTLPMTGFFTMVSWLPDSLQRIMVYSPLSNCVEMIRSGVFDIGIETHYSPLYTLNCCLVIFALGLVVFRFAEKHVQA